MTTQRVKHGIVALLVSAALVSTAFAVAKGASDRVEVASTSPVEWQRPELPREWVWQRKAVTFDDMYRQKR